jgi:hypothetical protein
MRFLLKRYSLPLVCTVLLAAMLVGAALFPSKQGPARAQAALCAGTFQDVAIPLMDLGSQEYIRMDGQQTGFTGGLYPQGGNQRPAGFNQDALEAAARIQPLDSNGTPDPASGKLVMISAGMSNASAEFGQFVEDARQNDEVNPRLVIINGALPNQTAERWSDPDGLPWEELETKLSQAGVAPAQVQVAWVKNVLTRGGDFPAKAVELQGHLEQIARNLKAKYPNIQITYFSSRTRSYTYWNGLSPEPVAYESAFSVKWMIEKQIMGDPALNYDPAAGPVAAPLLLWGPYLWANGSEPRSDGFTWLQEDLAEDCTHPSSSGVAKVAGLLMAFFTSDETAISWFTGAGTVPQPTPTPPPPTATRTLLPMVIGGTPTSAPTLPVEATQPPALPTQNLEATPIGGGLQGTSRAIVIGAAISGVVVITIAVGLIAARRR